MQVPEGRRVFGRLTVTENLEMGAFTRRDNEGIAAGYGACFRPVSHASRSVAASSAGTLSGGEQQMLATGAGPDGPTADPADGRAFDGPGAGAGGQHL